MRNLKQKVAVILSVLVLTSAIILPITNVQASTLIAQGNSPTVQLYSTVDPDPW